MRITATEWRRWILSGVGHLDSAVLPIAAAHGRTLVEDVRSRHDLPLWDNSAMDGFALHSADIAAASEAAPVAIAVVDEVLAGSSSNPAIPPGSAVRIMTGSPVPSDADAVAQVELTAEHRAVPRPDGAASADGAADAAGTAAKEAGIADPPSPDTVWSARTVRFTAPVTRGANIRRRGEDTPAGSLIARSGDALTAARLSALAAAGVAEVRVSELPRVGVLVTGAELRSPGDSLAPGQIVESNSLLIAGLLRESGIDPVAVHHCDDDAAAVRARLDELARDCDVIVTTGGVGPGSHDVMRLVTADNPGEPGVRAVRVAIRPGQPQCSGRLATGAWLFALPGNPVSAAASYELFVRPALLAMQGRTATQRPLVPAVAGAAWRGASGRLQVMPVVVDRDAPASGALVCCPAVNPRGVSHAVGGHGAVQAYALVGEEHGDIAAGDPVELIFVGSP
ncbi:MAG: gephyrin-like molybdotransferase Glp [Leucobacter sp.]